MNKIKLYLQETYNELMYKVTWPTWSELQNSAVVVSVASLLISLVVLAMDQVSKQSLRAVYKMLIG
ncbi:MAG: preprotein translocase subunit SecE [Chitinophagales bacterium]|nr:preprotein translocase subunit SecE [Chitinophagales bacterium]